MYSFLSETSFYEVPKAVYNLRATYNLKILTGLPNTKHPPIPKRSPARSEPN